ncbi:MAG: aldo/keto reductase [Spirochaetota bacterium]
MARIKLGSTGIEVERQGFGALPLQRAPMDEAVAILRRALDGGIQFFDTARNYSDSEEKLGKAFDGLRSQVVLASKTNAKTGEAFNKDLETSLRSLRTNYLDLYQFHNPPFCPLPGDGTGLWEAMEDARRAGKVLHVGISNHRLKVARQSIASGLYETLQFPFSYLSGPPDLDLVRDCAQAGMGFIAMKALAGGLVANARAACAWISAFPGVLPIWGIQRMGELEEFLGFIKDPPNLSAELEAEIEKDRAELAGDFCRGCGYCMPCPQEIEINICARMSLLWRRAPPERFFTPESQLKMRRIESCTRCGACVAKCPYGLDTPALLRRNLEDYTAELARRSGP